MPKFKKSYKKRRYGSRLRDKKINTLVEKRINDISNANIQKNIKWYRYSQTYHLDGYNWNTWTSLPELTNYRLVSADALEAKQISNVGGFVTDHTPSELPSPVFHDLTIGVKGFQCRFSFINQSQYQARVQINLIWIPNLNANTEQSVDYLRPSVFMLYKKGSGNLVYDGWDKIELKNASSTLAHAKTTYTIIESKTFNIRGQTSTNTINTNKNKIVWLTHTWKNPKKHNVRPGETGVATPLTDGNYYFTIHHNLPRTQSIKYVAAATMKFRVFPPTRNVAYPN